MNKAKNILSKIKPLSEKRPDIVKEASRKALARMYPQIKLSEEKLEAIVNRLKKNAAATNTRKSKGVLSKIREMLFGKKALPERDLFSGAAGENKRTVKGIAKNIFNKAKEPLPERDLFSGDSHIPGDGENKRTVQSIAREILNKAKSQAQKIPGQLNENVRKPISNIASELMGDAPSRLSQQTGEGFAAVFDPMSTAIQQGISGRYRSAKDAIKKEFNSYKDILRNPEKPRTVPHAPEQGLEPGLGNYKPEPGDTDISDMGNYYKNLYKSTTPFRKQNKNNISPGEGN